MDLEVDDDEDDLVIDSDTSTKSLSDVKKNKLIEIDEDTEEYHEDYDTEDTVSEKVTNIKQKVSSKILSKIVIV